MTALWVDKFTNQIKELVEQKRELVSQRETLKRRIKGGEAYFSAKAQGASATELANGVTQMLEIIKELELLDKKITDLDIVIVTNLEMYLGNFTARIRMPERLNDAGDLIKHECVYAVPFNSDDPELKEITPDDIWFLKMIKDAYKATNITFVEKE